MECWSAAGDLKREPEQFRDAKNRTFFASFSLSNFMEKEGMVSFFSKIMS